MPNEPHEQRKAANKRALNIIYFIDSNRTRSIKISLASINFTLVVLLFFVTWAILSPYLLYRIISQNDVLREKYFSSVAAIFDYQSRYDGVYELAYPAEKKTEPTEEDSEDYVADHNEAQATQDSDDELKELDADPEGSSLTVETSSNAATVSIENPSLDKSNGNVLLEISMRNSKSPQKAEGSIWAVMTIKTRKGELTYVSSPSGLDIDKDGKATAPYRKATKYSIRYYKAESFKFTLPTANDGWITEVRLGMLEKSGNVVYHVIHDPSSPIDLAKLTKIASKAPNTTPSEEDAKN